MGEREMNLGRRESLRQVEKRMEAEVVSHRDSLRAALPPAADVEDVDGERVVALAMALHEKLLELRGVRKKISILDRELGD